MNKFKAVAVKARKELDNSKREVCNSSACLFAFVLAACCTSCYLRSVFGVYSVTRQWQNVCLHGSYFS